MSITETSTTDEALVSDLCHQLIADADPRQTPPRQFLGLQFDRGLAWVHFPVGNGGLGKSPRLQRTINEIQIGRAHV